MYCPKCGEVVGKTATTCSNCGATILQKVNKLEEKTTGVSKSSDHVQPATEHEYRNLGGFLLALTILGIISLCLMVYAFVERYQNYVDLDEESRYVTYIVNYTGVIQTAKAIDVTLMISYVIMGIFMVLHIKAVFQKDPVALKRFEQFTIVTLLGDAVAFFISFMASAIRIPLVELITVGVIYLIVCLYYTNSVRVRTYFGSSAYASYSLLWQNANIPQPAVPDN